METLSSGCTQLDALVEALWPGDNVVFVGGTPAEYAALVEPALAYARGVGLQAMVVGQVLPEADDLTGLTQLVVDDIWDSKHAALWPYALDMVDARAYVAVQELSSLFAEEQAVAFFTTVCPALYHRRAVAYWHLADGAFSARALAEIRDCTQVFVRLEHNGAETIITPLKVLGRYADDMFRPHRLTIKPQVNISPLQLDPLAQGEYARTLEMKNRELTAIRDELNRANARLEEQRRLYDSLSSNLEQLVKLLEQGRSIGASLSLEQVQEAILRAASTLFQSRFCRLTIKGGLTDTVVEQGSPEALDDATLRQVQAVVTMRSPYVGHLQVWTRASALGDDELGRMLGYLASEAGIALDNAELYRETETQKEQLRKFVNEVIANEERDSRRLAFDLHDGLVQQIVAAYQHLQTAQAWRARDAQVEERELERGVSILKESIVEARRLIGQLRPAGLDDFGLARAVRLFANQQAAANEWDVELEVDSYWPALPPMVEAALYRIVQEATNNARKYARSKRLLIALHTEPHELAVIVQDWGCGFDPEAVPVSPEQTLRMGLVGIRERTNLLGGVCVIRSAPGSGTRVEIRIPRELALEDRS